MHHHLGITACLSCRHGTTTKFVAESHILEKYHEIRQQAIFCALPWAERGGAA
ncbi:hypothetical protein [Belnapia rosea]|uniref:hypothetical protein n=1 Tax=Belnapia rosea TaxID=938405 RepID=UPI001C409B8F|nr:hypothetical protein [Belnapia rosea]